MGAPTLHSRQHLLQIGDDVALTLESEAWGGLFSGIDLLNYLRRRMK